MQGRNIAIIAIAIVLGLVAVVIANGWFSGIAQRQEQEAEEQKLERIVVATQPMEFGTQLTTQNIRLQNWPVNSMPEGAFRTIPDALKDNRVALRPIVPGEPILASKVSGTDGRATLAALIPEGMRAYSIPVTAQRGVAGFVLPGTMVDVMLTRKIDGEGADANDLRADVILENVQVLAVDQLANDKQGNPKVSRVATLAVPIFDAQRLSIAQRMGTLSLALRKVESPTLVENGRMTERTASTVTNRQIGGARLYIAAKGRSNSSANYSQPAGAAVPTAYRGPTMSVVRGTEVTQYPVGYLGGW